MKHSEAAQIRQEQLNKQYREEIRQLIELTENTHILQSIYTVALTHLKIEQEKGA